MYAPLRGTYHLDWIWHLSYRLLFPFQRLIIEEKEKEPQMDAAALENLKKGKAGKKGGKGAKGGKKGGGKKKQIMKMPVNI